jgi:hypothetical protein
MLRQRLQRGVDRVLGDDLLPDTRRRVETE